MLLIDKWVRSALAHAAISQADLARRLTERLGRSIDRAAVNKMVKGSRRVAGDEMLAISEITGYPTIAQALATTATAIELAMEDVKKLKALSDEARVTTRALIKVPRAGSVEAGVFREVDNADDYYTKDTILAPEDEYFPGARQMFFDVLGDSMDRAVPVPIAHGAVIICVDFEDANIPLQDGMKVVVEQTRDGGHIREWSVKEVVQFEDRVEFQPRSSNQRHKAIVVPRNLDADDGRTVRVLALVRHIYNVEPPPISRPAP